MSLAAGTIIGVPIGLLADDVREHYIPASMIGAVSCTAIFRLTWISRIMPIQAFGIGFMIGAIPFGLIEIYRHYDQIFKNGHGSDSDGLGTVLMIIYGFWTGCTFLALGLIVQLANRMLIKSKIL